MVNKACHVQAGCLVLTYQSGTQMVIPLPQGHSRRKGWWTCPSMVLLLGVMEGMFSISQKAVACVTSVYWFGLRLGTLHKSCRDHCPWRTCSIPCLLLAGVTSNNHQIPGAFPSPSVPRQELHHHPCVTAALLHGFPSLSPSSGEQGRVHSNRKEQPSDHPCIWYYPSLSVCYPWLWIWRGWIVQRQHWTARQLWCPWKSQGC